jgi:hypothetical protein
VLGKAGTLLGVAAVAILLAAGGVGAAVAVQQPPDRPTVVVPANPTIEFEPAPDAEAPVPAEPLPDPTTTTTAPPIAQPATPAAPAAPATSGGTAVSFTIAAR